MNIVNVGYDSTNYYIVEAGTGKLLIDCGWPGTLPKLTATLKRKGISLKEINHLLVTHFHPDHAGLAQELKRQGTRFIVLNCQADFIAPFARYFEGKNVPYMPITQDDNVMLDLGDSRNFLARLGLQGEILHTPGHSDDSITLILDEGYAFTGDLHPSFMSIDDPGTSESWAKIRRHNIVRIFPGHGG